jgi:hypothetical protein
MLNYNPKTANGASLDMRVAERENISLSDVVHTDFKELVYAAGAAKAQLMVILGHVLKMVFGWAVGERANTKLALEAWCGDSRKT